MPDDQNAGKEKQEGEEQTAATSDFPLKPSGDVVLTQVDSPPPSGKHSIHPRRPAPIVRERRPEKADEDSPDK